MTFVVYRHYDSSFNKYRKKIFGAHLKMTAQLFELPPKFCEDIFGEFQKMTKVRKPDSKRKKHCQIYMKMNKLGTFAYLPFNWSRALAHMTHGSQVTKHVSDDQACNHGEQNVMPLSHHKP